MAHSTPQGANRYDTKLVNGERKPLTEPVPVWKPRTCRRHKRKPPMRTPSYQFLIFSLMLGFSRLFAGITTVILSTSSENQGFKWWEKGSEYMWPWLVAVSTGASSTMALASIVFTFAKFRDWLVTLSHIVGACVGAGEAALVIMENMSNTWKLTRLL